MKHEHHHDESDPTDPSKSSACCHHQKDEMHKTTRPASESEGVIYTCPIHLEIRQSSPGNCPICGMALEPVMIEASSAPNHEYLDMRRRFWLALALTIPVYIMEMSGHWQGHGGSTRTSIWIQMILTTPIVLWGGWPFFLHGFKSLQTRHLNMFTLISIRIGVAWVYSIVATLFPGIFPSPFRDAKGPRTIKRNKAAGCSGLLIVISFYGLIEQMSSPENMCQGG